MYISRSVRDPTKKQTAAERWVVSEHFQDASLRARAKVATAPEMGSLVTSKLTGDWSLKASSSDEGVFNP